MAKLTLYHGTVDVIKRPFYHGGKPNNDYGYGFYCAENVELAKEWSCTNVYRNGFANRYTIDLTGLKILDLTDKKYSILNWLAILLKFRTFDVSNQIAMQGKEYLLRNFYINVDDYDIIIGYRADDSYFSYAKDFINNTISLSKLSKAMELGDLGKQIVIISKKAFERLAFEGSEEVFYLEYFVKKQLRDMLAKQNYHEEIKKSISSNDDIYIIDIMRKGIKNGNQSI